MMMLTYAGGRGVLSAASRLKRVTRLHVGGISGCSERWYSVTRITAEDEGDAGETTQDKQTRADWLRQLDRACEQVNATSAAGSSSSIQNVFPAPWTTLSFSRSSGPGGQNVNKVNSKVRLRLHLSKAVIVTRGGESEHAIQVAPMPVAVARYLHVHSSYYIARHHELALSCDKSRSQADNVRGAFEKLLDHLRTLLGHDIEGTTSEEQRERVRRLIERDKRQTKRQKSQRKQVKEHRRSGSSAKNDVGF